MVWEQLVISEPWKVGYNSFHHKKANLIWLLVIIHDYYSANIPCIYSYIIPIKNKTKYLGIINEVQLKLDEYINLTTSILDIVVIYF